MSLGTFGGVKTVTIASLYRPGNVAQQRAKNKVTGVEAAVAEVGEAIHFPVIRKTGKGWEVVTGQHRVTAEETAGKKTVQVRTWSGTDAEAERLRYLENAARAHLSVAELAELEMSVSAQLQDSKPGHVPPAQRVKGETRKVAAEAEGVTPEAIRKRQQRAAKEEAPSSESVSLPDGFETWGVEVGGLWSAAVSAISDALREIDHGLRRSQAEVTRLEKERCLSALQAQGLRKVLHEAGDLTRSTMPASVCAYCKDPGGELGKREKCNGCGGRGWLSADQLAQAPQAYRQAGVVEDNGQVRTKPAIKQMTIEMNGRRMTPEDIAALPPVEGRR